MCRLCLEIQQKSFGSLAALGLVWESAPQTPSWTNSETARKENQGTSRAGNGKLFAVVKRTKLRDRW